MQGVPPVVCNPYPGWPKVRPGFTSGIGFPDESQVNGTDEFAPDSANGLKIWLGVIAVLVEFTAPISSGVTVPLKSPESSSASERLA